MGQELTLHVTNDDLIAFSNAHIDRENCIIRGVTVIKSGIVADGHDLAVDAETVKGLYQLAVKRGKVPVTLEHTGGIKDVNGYLDNFSIQGNKLKADWHLLENHQETPVMLERAERQPETFGMSCAFKGSGVDVKGKKCARAEKLLSVDCVKRPAAAPDGLFSAKDKHQVDKGTKIMPDNEPTQNEPTLADVMAALEHISARQDQFEEIQNNLVEHINQSIEGDDDVSDLDLLEALYNASDEELADFNAQHGTNFTREMIEAEVDAYNAAISGEPQGGEQSEGAEQGAESGSPVAAALSALAKEVIALKEKENFKELTAKAQADEMEFAQLEQNIGMLVEQRDRLVELSERVISENEALRMAGVRGGKPAGAGAEIEFKERSEGGSIIEFETVANEAYKEFIRKGLNPISAKSKAIDFAVKRHPVAYQLWRNRKSPEIRFSAE